MFGSEVAWISSSSSSAALLRPRHASFSVTSLKHVLQKQDATIV
jgi:hypothetical protein